MMKKHLLTSIFILNHILLFADNWYGKTISINEGLSQASATCIAYNNDGALWIGTQFGLNEYSNGKIKPFTKSEYGLPGSYINDIFCSNKDNSLWVSSEKGLHVYDSHRGIFQCISAEPTNCVLEHNDTLFIGGHKGLLYYNNNTKTIEGKESTIWTDILNLYSYKDTLICIDRKNGISLHKGDHIINLNINELEGHTLMASCMDGELLYLSILGEGVLVYNISKRVVQSYIGNKRKELAIVLSINKINNDIWIGTDGEGIWILKAGNNNPTHFEDLYSTNPGTEIPKAVTCIFKDPFDNIWVGGERFGVTGLHTSPIRSFLTNTNINFLYQSPQKTKLFVGTDGDGIYSYTLDKFQSIHYTETAGMKITTIADYDNDHIIICSYNQGFYLLNTINGHLQPFYIIDTETNSTECLYGNSPEIYKLPNGDLIFFAVHNYMHTPGSNIFLKLKTKQEEYASDLKAIYSRKLDDIYTYSKEGIFKVNIKELNIERILAYNNTTGYINSIAYNDKEFMFGTDNGLFSLNLLNHTATPIHSNLFNRVTQLCFDRDSTLWVSADNSLFKYNKGYFNPMGENKGVSANELTKSTLLQDGTVVLGGSNGFLSINEDTKIPTTPLCEKKFSLHEINLDGKTIYAQNQIIKIPHKSKNLCVTISLSQADPLEKIVYKYQVTGNSSYTIESFEESFQVPIQKTGTYNLNISYLKNDGKWSYPQTVLYIYKLKPWYITTPALIFYLLSFLLSATLFVLHWRKKMLIELQSNIQNKDSIFINKFETYINEHLAENDLNVEQIAEEMAMSRASLYIKVKNSFSKGIGEYIEEKRMEEAIRLIKNTKMSIAEISDQVGYSTARYFSARFKIYTGSSPLSFRKKQVYPSSV